jgi:dihydroorotate dehydrogenase (fumarate)
MNLSTTVAGITLEHPIMNSPSGPGCKTTEDVTELIRSASAAAVVGSVTKEPREGNEGQGETYFSSQIAGFSLNSLGLPNGGLPYYRQRLPEMVRIAHEAKKTLWVSGAGFTPEEFLELTIAFFTGGADLVELNLGCPNVWDGGKQKRIFCFDPALVQAVLQCLEQGLNVDRSLAITIKVSPYSDPMLLEEVASVVAASPIVSAITTPNTFPNAFAFRENGESAISPKFSRGLAGMAGPALKPIGLGQVMQWRELLPSHIDVIGGGGICTGRDAYDYLRAGAKAVQIGTKRADHGAGVFDQIVTQLIPLLEAEPIPS